MSFQELVSLQEEVGNQINRAFSNYKKSKSRITEAYIETRLESLESSWVTYKQTNLEISKTATTELRKTERYFTEDTFYTCEDVYLEFKTLMKEHLAEINLPKISTSSEKEATHKTETQKLTKLPPIKIPTFSGNYTEWPSFYDLFKSLIHTNSTLSNIQKYHYLKSSLTGEAEGLLRQFPLTDGNYNKALTLLENRFDNKRLIVHAHITRLINQRKLSTETARGIRDILDTTNECLSALNTIGVHTESWDAIVTHIIVAKLDIESHRLWEQKLGASRDISTTGELLEFMEVRFRSLEALNVTQTKEPTTRTPQRTQPIKTFATSSQDTTTQATKSSFQENKPSCVLCSGDHYVYHCQEFIKMTTEQRRDLAQDKQLCFNCLVPNHPVRFCRQRTTCRICSRRHHTLLHTTNEPTTAKQCSHTQEEPEEETTPIAVHKVESTKSQVLLATALVRVMDRDGQKQILRALIDQGSQASFITESAAQRLGLRRTGVCSRITGVDSTMATVSKAQIELALFSLSSEEPVAEVKAHILKSLQSILPSREFTTEPGSGIRELTLADPDFCKPGGIDMLLGADIYAHILLDGLRKFGTLLAQNSRLGWIVSGAVQGNNTQVEDIVVMHNKLEVDDLLQKFWESEELHTEKRTMTKDEKQCEKIYEETHSRTPSGRYKVALPFIDEIETLGESKDVAVKRLMNMERRFKKDGEFQQRYIGFMKEYEDLGHMEKVPKDEIQKSKTYYLPHHGVLREESTTTKLRVVFDGSAQTSSGTSLNEQLLIGPSLQHDIRDIFLRWRKHNICLVADIQRMYRQILVREDDVDYQRIVWRSKPEDPIQDYRLLTVTYGTSCAPYLAIKTLRQLASDESDKFPKAASVLQSDCYMDDILCGCDTVDEAIQLSGELIDLSNKGGFVLHKWNSNSVVVLESLPTENNQTRETINIMMDKTVKTLGVRWNPSSDCFELNMKLPSASPKVTKRSVLSDVATIYDPLGWLSPVVIVAKMFLQRLWLLGLGWDDELPNEVKTEWLTYRDEINTMSTIYLPRWIGMTRTIKRVELHGFSDASITAFGGVVFVRIIREVDTVEVKMVSAKTKVAPVKQVTLPRLELCGAVLTAKLLHKVKVCLDIPDDQIYGWTDSTIVLAWLQKHPNSWKTFVGNRVAEILNVTKPSQWHHVSSKDNPADCASRGLPPAQLAQHELWWTGPQWLNSPHPISCVSRIHETDLEEKIVVNMAVDDVDEEFLLHKYSTLMKLKRVIGYCFRFVHNCKRKAQQKNIDSTDDRLEETPKFLVTSELKRSMNACIKISQNRYFSDELHDLSHGQTVNKKSSLYFLHPFLDTDDIIRVGGRLKNAPLPYDTKHPVVVSGKSRLASLLVDQTHKTTLHGGPLLMLNVIRSNYWITNLKSIAKFHVRKCIQCIRQAPRFASQIMGNLPAARVTVSKPFSSSGVDFAGPILLKSSRLRNAQTTKAYIAVFICTATKAIHLELVSELTTEAFIASYKRFTSRRGHCAQLYSDCGSNFIGANFELKRMLNKAKSELPEDLSQILASEGTEWHFIPPGSPHFGGLWESGVRSTKHHIKRVLGDTKLTFEEYATLLAQIESCLNSRPISPMSDSVDDLTALTPGHFLVLGPPVVVPHENVMDVPVNRLNRWQHLEHMLQSFWQRWKSEYLTTLQNRYKWSSQKPSIKINDLVIIKDDRVPPSKWPLARVIDTHPGNDGLIRVVSLKCLQKVIKRPITKLCVLPFIQSTEN